MTLTFDFVEFVKVNLRMKFNDNETNRSHFAGKRSLIDSQVTLTLVILTLENVWAL